MRKTRQRDIKRYCLATFPYAIKRFGTIDRYERFVRRFYTEHNRYPRLIEWGKRHGKNDRVRRQVVRQKWDKKRGFRVPSIVGIIKRARKAQRDAMRGKA